MGRGLRGKGGWGPRSVAGRPEEGGAGSPGGLGSRFLWGAEGLGSRATRPGGFGGVC